MRSIMKLALGGLFCLTVAGGFAGEKNMFSGPNAKILRCKPLSDDGRLVKGNEESYLFYPGQRVELTFSLQRKNGGEKQRFLLLIQAVHTRKPNKSSVFIDPYGYPDVLNLDGETVIQPFEADFGGQKAVRLTLEDVKIPERYGTYCLMIIRGDDKGGERLWAGAVARVLPRKENGTVENTPIFGESTLPGIGRMGIRGVRCEISWKNHGDAYDWKEYDQLTSKLKAGGLQAMFTLGGVGSRMYAIPTKDQPIPAAVGPKWNGSPYGGQADWGCAPKNFDKYEAWVREFAQRYWEDGKGALWGFENYNEPWEGGGISGYARDCLSYRGWQMHLARAAHSVSNRIRICAASSIMNTEDKFFSEGPQADGTFAMDPYIDVFTDHYVPPYCAYGPQVAAAHGKFSIENETWLVISEYLLPQIMCQWLAVGQRCVMPFHPTVLFEEGYPTTVPVATAAFNHFITGLRFKRLAFQNHLPWLFQFGEDKDPHGVCVLLGQLITRGGPTPQDNPEGRIWRQVDAVDGGSITLDNRDGALRFFDVAGNPVYAGVKEVTIPLNILPTYVFSNQGPELVTARIAAGMMKKKHPCEILPRDFITRVTDPEFKLQVGVGNRLNHTVSGTLRVSGPEGFRIRNNDQKVELAAGEVMELQFSFDAVKSDAGNRYPFRFELDTDAGRCEYAETLNCAVAPQRHISVDGRLEDWDGVPAIMLTSLKAGVDLDELARKPWLKREEELGADGAMTEFRLAWDEENIYASARVLNKKPQMGKTRLEGRDENSYFHSAASDQEEPWKSWLAKHAPGASFAEASFIYKKNPGDMASDGDRLQLAFDVTKDRHGLMPVTEVPTGFTVAPDTDYEFSAYLCADGQSELWTLLTPKMPRMHDWPRQPRGGMTTGPTRGAKHVVRQEGDVRIYEIAIPKQEVPELKLQTGSVFGFLFYSGAKNGRNGAYGEGKAVTKWNSLSLHPYWQATPSCDIHWALIEE